LFATKIARLLPTYSLRSTIFGLLNTYMVRSGKTHHPNSKHNQPYDFQKLVAVVPDLKPLLIKNPAGQNTLSFHDPNAVRLLNKALLLSEYGLTYWDIPVGQLCPPIPGRADYIHYLADLIKLDGETKEKNVLDIGVGCSLIYPVLGAAIYGWSFVGSDVAEEALANASKIVDRNARLQSLIALRLQTDKSLILKNIIRSTDYFDAVMCNPPFFKSKEEAYAQANRKVTNLGHQDGKGKRNFGGQSNELWYPGGELRFVSTMIKESTGFRNQVGWFTSLISNKDHLYPLQKLLKKCAAEKVEVVKMQQGNKKSRFLAWKFV
jgi:23S rRNA (adenine1618-N6)-methyltransferase